MLREEVTDVPRFGVWGIVFYRMIYIGTVSRATLMRLLRDGLKCVWAFPSSAKSFWWW